MRLFYEADGVRLFDGDCREAGGVLGGQQFDLVFADPPYGQTSCAWDRWPCGWIASATTWLSPRGSLWCWGTLRTFMDHGPEFFGSGLLLAQDCIWEKHNGSQPNVDRFLRVHEQVAHFYPASSPWKSIYRDPQRVEAPPEHQHKKGRVVHRRAQPAHTGTHKPSTYVDDGMRHQRSVWKVRSMHRKGAGVATPKPPGVLDPIIRYSCPPDGWVLVPFAGGGAEMEAAVRSGRNVVGFDTDRAALEHAVRRLRAPLL